MAHSRRYEESRSTRNEDHSVLRSRTEEEERQRRRREWQLQQERERQHEKLKQQMILDYERKRAQALKYHERDNISHHSEGKRHSKSPSQNQHRRRSTSSVAKSDIISEKLHESATGAAPLFKGPEGTQISVTELRRIKVDIRRNIPVKGIVTELQRDILNPEDLILKRREGEGCKPIFEREEIKRAESGQVEEQRTVVAIDHEQSVSTSKLQYSKKHSPLSPTRNRSCSPRYLPYQSRHHTDSKHRDNRLEHRDHHKSDGKNSSERHKEYKEKYTERDTRRYSLSTNRSRSRERDQRNSRSFMDERCYREKYRDKSRERSRERRDRSRERRDIAPHYIEPVPVPIYYGNFPPRPIMVSPMVPIRGQVPPISRGRHPALMAPLRPFPPRFVPPDMYRLGHPVANPRYGPMF